MNDYRNFKPKYTAFEKYRKNKTRNNTKKFSASKYLFPKFIGDFSQISIEAKKITAQELIAIKRTISFYLAKKGNIFINVFPDIPVTRKAPDARMGKGKGLVNFWIANVKEGQSIMEVKAPNKELILVALKKAQAKISIKTQIIKRSEGMSL